jgi:hypothetical protein
VRDEFAGVGVGHGAEFLETFLDLRLAIFGAGGDAGFQAGLYVCGYDGGVAVEAGAGLFEMGDALGLVLVLEHVGVAAFLAVIDGEGVAFEDLAPAGVLIEFLEGVGAAVLGALDVHGAFIGVVLARVVFAPDGGIDGVVVDVDDAEDVLGGLCFAGYDVLVEKEHAKGGDGGGGDEDDVVPEGEAAFGGVHVLKRCKKESEV